MDEQKLTRKRMCEVKYCTQGRVVESFLFVVLVGYGSNGHGQRVWESAELMICHSNYKHRCEMLLALCQNISMHYFIFIPKCALGEMVESARLYVCKSSSFTNHQLLMKFIFKGATKSLFYHYHKICESIIKYFQFFNFAAAINNYPLRIRNFLCSVVSGDFTFL